jgi:hypothetical protein
VNLVSNSFSLCVVVGGYLAFIGYFCLEAGVALCISDTIMKPSDWYLLFDERALILAMPGILAGIALTAVARKCQDEAMLPISMVVIPMIFYVVLFVSGLSIAEARKGGWVGETSQPVPVTALFHLVDFEKVQWHLCKELIPIWLGKFGVLMLHMSCQSYLSLLSIELIVRNDFCGIIFILPGCRCYFDGHGTGIRHKQ